MSYLKVLLVICFHKILRLIFYEQPSCPKTMWAEHLIKLIWNLSRKFSRRGGRGQFQRFHLIEFWWTVWMHAGSCFMFLKYAQRITEVAAWRCFWFFFLFLNSKSFLTKRHCYLFSKILVLQKSQYSQRNKVNMAMFLLINASGNTVLFLLYNVNKICGQLTESKFA